MKERIALQMPTTRASTSLISNWSPILIRFEGIAGVGGKSLGGEFVDDDGIGKSQVFEISLDHPPGCSGKGCCVHADELDRLEAAVCEPDALDA